jgi:hypothetical protein
VLETVEGEMMTTWLESVVRSARNPIRQGEMFELRGLRVEVLQVGEHGPTKVMLTFDRNLEDPSLIFMAVRDGGLQRVEPPKDGESLTLPSPW